MHRTKFSPEHVVNSETHPMINHLHFRSFMDARLLTIPFYSKCAEHTLNKMRCAQTRVVKDTYLFIGLSMSKAMAATLINKPPNFSELPQWKYISPSCNHYWRYSWSLSSYLVHGDAETQFPTTYIAII